MVSDSVWLSFEKVNSKHKPGVQRTGSTDPQRGPQGGQMGPHWQQSLAWASLITTGYLVPRERGQEAACSARTSTPAGKPAKGQREAAHVLTTPTPSHLATAPSGLLVTGCRGWGGGGGAVARVRSARWGLKMAQKKDASCVQFRALPSIPPTNIY